MKRTLIVGGGASGLLVAIHMARNATSPHVVHIADPREVLGQGLAYSTKDESHLLNVPAGRMSIFPEEPDHFVQWTGKDANYFAPRRDYGRYLLRSFVEVQVATNNCIFEHIKSAVVSLSHEDKTWQVHFQDSNVAEYDDVVLAMGHGEPIALPQLDNLQADPRYIHDSWRQGHLPGRGRLVAIGTGLTFVDLALSHLRNNPENTVVGISRNGLLPEPHLAKRAPAAQVPDDVKRSPLAVRHFIEKSDDWRAAQDGVRHELANIWHSWSEEEKSSFFKEHLRWWNVHRHRVSPEVQIELKEALTSGRMKIVAGELSEVSALAEQLVVTTNSGEHFNCDLLINCLGYTAWAAGSLLGDLIALGVAQAGPLHLGIRTDFPRFNVVSGVGQVHENLYAIGPILLGERFETTAIPELRDQAREIALALTRKL